MSEFGGVITALATPFWEGALDEVSLVRLVRRQLESGITGFVVGGTTGESPTLSESELRRLFEIVRLEVGRKALVIVGSGANSTATTIEKTNQAEKWGADAALLVMPYYNRPPQRGLVAHFQKIARSTSLPLLLYNVPSRTASSIDSASVRTLSEEKNIIGIKEASGDLKVLHDLKSIAKKPFWLLSGDDISGLEFCLSGGHGIISVVSHLVPDELTNLIRAARDGNLDVRAQYRKYSELLRYLYCEANPIPLKWALKEMGIFRSSELRLPLVALDAVHTEGFRACLKNLALI
jgi:4-hydroxy-tetrahydrodipicolinate synthase